MASYADKKAALLGGRSGNGPRAATKNAADKAKKPAAKPTGVRPLPAKPARAGLRSSGLSAAQRADKKKEADEEYRQGMKFLQTSLTRWKPDHFSATSYFERAARFYRAADEHAEAKNAYLAAAESFREAENFGSSARNYALAAGVAEGLGDDREASSLYREAAMSAHMTAAKLERPEPYLMKAAIAMAGESLEEAVGIVKEACEVAVPAEVVESGGEGFQPATAQLDCIRNAYAFLCEYGKFQEVLALEPRCKIMYKAMGQDLTLNQYFLSCTVLMLATSGFDAAWSLFESHLQDTEYLHSELCKAAENLLVALRSYDEEQLAEAKKQRRILSLSPYVLRALDRLTSEGVEAPLPEQLTSAGPAAATEAPPLIIDNSLPPSEVKETEAGTNDANLNDELDALNIGGDDDDDDELDLT